MTLACVVALLTAGVHAPLSAATELLTLDEALVRARASNRTLRAAQADVEAARGRLMQAGVIPANPVITGDLASHHTPPERHVDRAVTVGQEVEVGGQGGLRVVAAQHGVNRAEQLLADRRRTVDGEVRRAFAGLGAADRKVALAGESKTLADRLAEVARRRFKAGDVGELEIQLAQIETTRTTQGLSAAQTDRARAAARLAIALGADSQEALAVQTDDAEPAAIPAEPTLTARALEVRPDLAAARAERARLEAEARLTHRRGWVPNPTFSAFYRHEQADEEIVGGEVSVPLPVWNREQGTEIATLAAARGAAAEAERLAQEIPREVHIAMVRRAAAVSAWASYQREAVPAANAARDLIERAYANGYFGLPDVLVQRDRFIQVQAAAISAWLDLREADADLIEAVGEEVK